MPCHAAHQTPAPPSPCFLPACPLRQGQGYSPGVTLFGAGYDFRQSTRDSAKALLARLQVRRAAARAYRAGHVLAGARSRWCLQRAEQAAVADALPAPRAQEVSRRCGGARVDLVTHSLGGLVVRSLLADYPAEFEALVRWVRWARWVEGAGCAVRQAAPHGSGRAGQ